MDRFSERLVELFEELEAVEYSPVGGVQGLMGRLERIFWKIEQEGFPVMDDHRIGVLLRTLPGRAREVVHRIWGEFRCRLSYAELRRQISRHQFPEDLGESEDDEEDPEMDPDPEMEEDPEPEEVFEIEEDPEPEEVFEIEEDPEPEEVFEMEEDPEPEEVFEMEDDHESEDEFEEDSDEDVDIEIVDPDEDPEETVEDPDEVPEIPAPGVPVPLRDDLVMSLQLWMLFLFVWMYTLVGRVAPPN